MVVPGTADESRQASGMTPQAERQAIDDEQAKVPGDAIFRMSGQGVDGNVRITSTSVHIEDGQPVWYLGGFGKCGGAIPPPEQQAAIRAYFAKYTTAEVRFEKGRLISTTPVNIAKLKGCE